MKPLDQPHVIGGATGSSPLTEEYSTSSSVMQCKLNSSAKRNKENPWVAPSVCLHIPIGTHTQHCRRSLGTFCLHDSDIFLVPTKPPRL